MAKESEYVEEYGFDLFFPEKVINSLGRELQVENDKDEVTMRGVVTDYRWSDTWFKVGNEKYLGVEFQFDNEAWTPAFPTEIKRPPIDPAHTARLLSSCKEAFKNDLTKT